jgi:superfamily II DNA or RNA helicase
MARSVSLRGAPAWKRVLGGVEKRERESQPYRAKIRYDLDVGPAKLGGALIVHVRANFGTEEHPILRPAHLRRASFDLLDPADAAMIALLDGITARAPTSPYGALEPTFAVPSALIPPVLQRLAATARAHVAGAAGATDPGAPAIALDEAGEYELVLEVHAAAAGALGITPLLERDVERVPIGAPLLLVGDVVLFRDRVAPFDDGGQPEWVVAAREEGSVPLPEADLPPFLEELHARMLAPRVKLPPERAFARVQVAPRPYVLFRTRAARGISVELGLDYEGHRVHPYDVGHALVDRQGRRILDRDDDAERSAVLHLESLGGQPVAGRWRIAKRALLEVAGDLLARGWRVEIDGRLHRRPTGLSFGVASGIDWLDVLVHADFDGARLALPELLTAIRQRRLSVVLPDGSIGQLPEEWVERLRRWSALAEPTSETLRFKKVQAGLVAALAEKEQRVAVDAAFEKAREELRAFDGIAALDAPPTFHGALRDYQKRALGWFVYLRRFGFGGCLADDMGLGKTVQVLAMLDERRAAREGPSLVVCPRSVLYNWASEASRFAPDLRVHVHDGARRDAERFAEHDVVLTTYGLLRRDAEALARVRFDYVVLDEAQAIKTSRSAVAKVARSLDARHKLALSGTPLENHLGELASLLDFLNPGVLGTISALANLDSGGRRIDADTRDLLARTIRPFFLRRTKQEVARELPARVEQTIYCALEPEHQRLYDELRDHYRAALARRIAKDGWGRSAVHVLEAILRLRQLACHPGLVDRSKAEQPSAKLDALMDHLASARAEGQKALVFSQFTGLLALVRARLDAEGVSYEYLDGATKDRGRRVERFQSDPQCSAFLLSLKAGGVGLNLTAAEYVFLLDPWWNPATEAQAIDRAHRIGQTRTVFAYRLLARGTIEEKVEALQAEKRALADAFFGQGGAALGGLTREDLESFLA